MSAICTKNMPVPFSTWSALNPAGFVLPQAGETGRDLLEHVLWAPLTGEKSLFSRRGCGRLHDGDSGPGLVLRRARVRGPADSFVR